MSGLRSLSANSVFLACACSLWLGGRVEAQSAPLFGAPTWRIDPPPWNFVVTDLDADGRPDIATANGSAGLVMVLMSDAAGGLEAPVGFGTGTHITDLAAADLDGNGTLDIAAAGNIGVAVLAGAGDGTFVSGQNLPTPDTDAMAAADVDGDGDRDLLLVASALQVLLGAGDGTFAPGASLPFGTSADAVTLADLDEDGALDVAVPFASNALAILLGDGAGGFAAPVTSSTGTFPKGIASADLDGDGHVDVVTADHFGDTLSVFLGSGDGTFPTHESHAVGSGPLDVVLGDLDGDGHTDAATADLFAGSVSVLLGDGAGGFAEAQPVLGCHAPWRVGLADFDLDGHVDLATVDHNTGGSGASHPTGVTVIHGLGNGTFRGHLDSGSGAVTNHFTMGDFDSDGRLDVLWDWFYSSSGVVGIGRGDGTFSLAHSFYLGGTTQALLSTDLDGDGDLDIASVNGEISLPSTYNVAVLFGQGDGDFTFGSFKSLSYHPRAIASGDFDGDGFADLAVTGPAPDKVSVLHGLGAGGLAAPVDYVVDDKPDRLHVADADNDGFLDILCSYQSAAMLTRLKGNGDGTFINTPVISVAGMASGVTSGDFDANGLTDLVTMLWEMDQLAVLVGKSNGGFTQKNHPVGPKTFMPVVADFDGDQRQDIAASSSDNNTVAVLLGQGDGTFADGGLYGTSNWPTEMEAGDVDLDGRTDVVLLCVANYDSYTASALLNEAPSAWTKIGAALSGSQGLPSLYGTGSLGGGTSNAIHLVGAKPSSPTTLVVGGAQAKLPFKGGTLIPQPALLVALFSGPTGLIELPFVMPAGLPAGVGFVMQAWIKDAAGPKGFAASNGLTGTTP